MPDSRGAGDAKPHRPSFTGFWKRSKDKQAAQSLTFVSSKLGQPSAQGGNEAQTEPSAEAKAKERRQQVRKAQRQHRQRKANYTKQLEMDITKLRDDIAKAEQEVEHLKNQNDAIRTQLVSGGGDQAALPMAVDLPPVLDTTEAAFSTYLAPNYTVSLDMSEYLGTPAYQIRRASSSAPDSSTKTTSPWAAETVGGTTPASTVGTSPEDVAAMEATLSEEQIDRAINFILAYEPFLSFPFLSFPFLSFLISLVYLSSPHPPYSFIPRDYSHHVCGCPKPTAYRGDSRTNHHCPTARMRPYE
ncbi:hypothetical protein F4859DRAFT_499632 [Xylaria cf. heliscus]|nr:hypothetical protein F4859DRAFT_499632 [Xylaria cf. heliscus]